MQPDNAEMAFWHARGAGHQRRASSAARPLFARAFAADPRWRELVRRLPAVEQLPKDPKLMEEILAIPDGR